MNKIFLFIFFAPACNGRRLNAFAGDAHEGAQSIGLVPHEFSLPGHFAASANTAPMRLSRGFVGTPSTKIHTFDRHPLPAVRHARTRARARSYALLALQMAAEDDGIRTTPAGDFVAVAAAAGGLEPNVTSPVDQATAAVASFFKPRDEDQEKTKTEAIERLTGTSIKSVRTGEPVELSAFLKSSDDKAMLVFATYAVDFNAIEYVQRLRYYLPSLQEKGISKIGLVVNAEPEQARTLVDLCDLPTDATSPLGQDVVVELFADPEGSAGKQFGVGRGWLPNNEEIKPSVKLFGMLLGLGAWATLPAVIGGYIGNPFVGQPWIEDALAVGQRKKRWPDMAVVLEEGTGKLQANSFQELPLVGEWKRRPLELATLRLQNMLGISFRNWKTMSPTDEGLKAGVLTQLGGVLIVESATGEEFYSWRDPGICAVANFEEIVGKAD